MKMKDLKTVRNIKKNEEETNKRKDICAHGLEESC